MHTSTVEDVPSGHARAKAPSNGLPPTPEEVRWSAGLMFLGSVLTMIQFIIVHVIGQESSQDFLEFANSSAD
ncbi:MAG: hypothetical protein ACRC0L_10995, partial [Angustibacter sp.]